MEKKSKIIENIFYTEKNCFTLKKRFYTEKRVTLTLNYPVLSINRSILHHYFLFNSNENWVFKIHWVRTQKTFYDFWKILGEGVINVGIILIKILSLDLNIHFHSPNIPIQIMTICSRNNSNSKNIRKKNEREWEYHTDFTHINDSTWVYNISIRSIWGFIMRFY